MKNILYLLVISLLFISCNDDCEISDNNNQEQTYYFGILNNDFSIDESSSATISVELIDTSNILSSNEIIWDINTNYVTFSNIDNFNIVLSALEVNKDETILVKAFPKLDPTNIDSIYVTIKNKVTIVDTSICFERDILPIFVSNCAMSGCHVGNRPPDGLRLDNYNSIMKEIKPYDPNDSEIFEVITSNKSDKVMPPPPYSKLSSNQISLIKRWIEEGAKNTECNDTDCDLSNVTYSNTIQVIIQNNCVGCHNDNLKSGNLNLSTQELVKNSINSGKLISAIEQTAGIKMPPSYKLEQCDIDRIKKWAEEGYK